MPTLLRQKGYKMAETAKMAESSLDVELDKQNNLITNPPTPINNPKLAPLFGQRGGRALKKIVLWTILAKERAGVLATQFGRGV